MLQPLRRTSAAEIFGRGQSGKGFAVLDVVLNCFDLDREQEPLQHFAPDLKVLAGMLQVLQFHRGATSWMFDNLRRNDPAEGVFRDCCRDVLQAVLCSEHETPADVRAIVSKDRRLSKKVLDCANYRIEEVKGFTFQLIPDDFFPQRALPSSSSAAATGEAESGKYGAKRGRSPTSTATCGEDNKGGFKGALNVSAGP